MQKNLLPECQNRLQTLEKFRTAGERLLKLAHDKVDPDLAKLINPTLETPTKLRFNVFGTEALIQVELQPTPLGIDARLVPCIIELAKGEKIPNAISKGLAFTEGATFTDTRAVFPNDLLQAILGKLLLDHPVAPFTP